MKNILLFELKRCFESKRTWIALLIGVSISLGHIIFNVYPLSKWLSSWEGDLFLTPHSAFGHWIGMDSATIWPTLLYLLLPFLAALPFTQSTYWDINSGYCIQIFSRAKRTLYFRAKFITVFLSGTFITFVILIFDFWATSLFLPLVRPEVLTNLYSINDRSLFGDIFYLLPLVYTVTYIIFDAIFIGIWECIVFAIGNISKNTFQVVTTPFLAYLLIYFVFNWLRLDRFAPFAILLPFQPAQDVSATLILVYLIAIPFVSYGIYVSKRKKSDVL